MTLSPRLYWLFKIIHRIMTRVCCPVVMPPKSSPAHGWVHGAEVCNTCSPFSRSAFIASLPLPGRERARRTACSFHSIVGSAMSMAIMTWSSTAEMRRTNSVIRTAFLRTHARYADFVSTRRRIHSFLVEKRESGSGTWIPAHYCSTDRFLSPVVSSVASLPIHAWDPIPFTVSVGRRAPPFSARAVPMDQSFCSMWITRGALLLSVIRSYSLIDRVSVSDGAITSLLFSPVPTRLLSYRRRTISSLPRDETAPSTSSRCSTVVWCARPPSRATAAT